jgi:GT2 family glycosyltransferase/lipopolysaccharide/colanic/teichoic acid biosynthesis glycosyltransferase
LTTAVESRQGRPDDGSGRRPRVSVVIVHYRTPDLLRSCLESLRAHLAADTAEALIVDNASAELRPAGIEGEFPGVRLLPQERNLGYAKAVNLAMAAGIGDYFLVLNPDIVVRPGAIETLLDAADARPDAGIIAPRLLNPDGSLQYSCRRFYDFRTFLFRRTPLGRLMPGADVLRRHLMLDYDHLTARAVDWVLGGAMLVRRAAVADVGGMDERFFLYFEDVDWCYRMHQRGWRVVYEPRAAMVHHHRRESARRPMGKSFFSHLMSVVRFYEKWSLVLYLLKTQRAEIGRAARFVLDVGAVNLGFITAYVIRMALSQMFEKPVFGIAAYRNFWLFGNALAIGTFYILGMYRRTQEGDWIDRLFAAARATGIITIVMMAATFLLYRQEYSRFMVTLFWPLSTIFVLLGRQSIAWVARSVRGRRLDLPRVAVVGSPEDVAAVRAELSGRGEVGFEAIYLPGAGGWSDGGRWDAEDRDRFFDLVRAERIASVYFVSPGRDVRSVVELVPRLARAGVTTRLRPEFAAVLHPDARVESVGGTWSLALDARTRWQVRGLGKRLFDISASTLGILLALAPNVVYVLSRWWAGRRPVLSTEERYVRPGEPVRYAMYSPRPRGNIFQVVFLDHYPRLFSVFRGTLSFVGLYPFRREEFDRLPETHRGVSLDAKPGVTGLWWFYRGEGLTPERLRELDLEYVQKWSLSYEMKTLMRAVTALIRSRGRLPELRQDANATTGPAVRVPPMEEERT